MTQKGLNKNGKIKNPYKKENDKLVIIPIADESDYDLVDVELEKWWNKSEY